MKKITINRQLLLSNLKHGIGIIQESGVIPVFSCFLFEKKSDRIILTCANSEMNIITDFECRNGDDVKILITGNIFFNTLSLLKEEDVILQINDKHQLNLVSGKKKYSIPSFEPSAFSPMIISDKIKGIFLPGDEITVLIRKALAVTNKRAVEAMFKSVELRLENKILHVTGCQNACMYQATLNHDNEDASIYLTDNTAEAFVNIATKETVFFGTDGKHSVVKFGNIVINAVTISSKYSDVRPLFRAQRDRSFTVKKEDILSAAKRLKLFAGQKDDVYIINDGKTITMKSQYLEAGKKAEEEIEGETIGQIPELRLNSKFLQIIINNIESESITFKCGENERIPLVIRGANESAINENFILAMISLAND